MFPAGTSAYEWLILIPVLVNGKFLPKRVTLVPPCFPPDDGVTESMIIVMSIPVEAETSKIPPTLLSTIGLIANL